MTFPPVLWNERSVNILGDAFKTELPGGVYEKDFQPMETLGRPDRMFFIALNTLI